MQKFSLHRLLLLAYICSGHLPVVHGKCQVHFNAGRTDLETPYQIECSQISTPQDVLVLKNALENSTFDDDPSITIFLDSSQLDLLPANLFLPHKVTNLMFHNCRMSKMPYDLVCSPDVRLVTFITSPIPGSKLTPGGFKNCTKLRYLSLRNTSLVDIPAGSFRGLDNLVELWLLHNNIQNVPDLSGLENSMTRLVLAFNSISFIGKNAFRNMQKLTSLILQNANITEIQDGAFDDLGSEVQVSLSENPLHCDCSLDWLKRWLQQHPLTGPQAESYGIPYCATPMVGPLMNLTYCSRTTFPSDGEAQQDNVTTTQKSGTTARYTEMTPENGGTKPVLRNGALLPTGKSLKIGFVLTLLLLSF